MSNLNKRCRVFGMDARREMQRMVVPFASFATPQTPEYTATRRAVVALSAFRRCKPLVVKAQPHALRLGLRSNRPQRMYKLLISEPLKHAG